MENKQENHIDSTRVRSVGENNKGFHILHFHEVRERPWLRNIGRPFLVIPSSNVLDDVIRCYRPSGQYERRAALSHRRRLPGKKSATTATDAARRGAAARYGSPVRRYTQRAGDRSIMLSGRFWNPASRDKIPCGRDAADVKKPRSRSGSRETRRLVRPKRGGPPVRRDVRFSLMSKKQEIK